MHPQTDDHQKQAFYTAIAKGRISKAFQIDGRAAALVENRGEDDGTGFRIVDLCRPTPFGRLSFSSFAFNNLNQVAFVASLSVFNPQPLGVFPASPVAPANTSIKLKQKKGGLQLRVNGTAMITNNTVIEINGVPLMGMDYPADSREDGGTSTEVVSRAARLEQLLQARQPAEVTVFNRLTNERSAPRSFVR